MSAELPHHVQSIVDTISGERRRHEREASTVQRVVNRVTRAIARPRFLAAVVLIATVWVAFNLLAPFEGYRAFDPPPFSGLANAACVLALAVTVLILMTQRHENELAEVRAELTLQLAILNEQKSAKAIELLDRLRRDLPSVRHSHDPELAALAEPADAVTVLDAIRESVVDAGRSVPEA